MHRITSVWTKLRLLFLLLIAMPAFASGPPPLEVFGKLPAERDPIISADGHWLAWIDQRTARPRIVVFDVRNHKVHRTVEVPDLVKVHFLVWGDDDVMIVSLSKTDFSPLERYASREEFRFMALSAEEGPARPLPLAEWSTKPVALEAHLLVTRTARPHTAIMSVRQQFCHCLLAVDTLTGKSTVLKHGTDATAGWIVDGTGTALAREDWDAKTRTYHLLALHDEPDKPVEIQQWEASSNTWAAGVLSNGSAIVLVATNGRPHLAAWALPLDGSPLQLLAEDPQGDIVAMHIHAPSGGLDGAYVSGPVTTVRWFDPAIAKRQEALQRSFPNREVYQAGWTDDATRILVQTQSPAAAPVYYLVDFTSHRADIAAEEYPELTGAELTPAKEITYAARDGTPIPAYLTVPVKAAGPVPLVVLPHGGPADRDFLQFNWLVQFLASRDYAVLQPQYRGSFGFGDAWLRAGYREWGGLMQDDVSDGVRAMIQLGVADATRVCVVGAGYGGYVALAGAAFTPELFKCAVSIGGISDLAGMVRERTPRYGPILFTESAIKERIGVPGDPQLAARSPINGVKNIRVPVLLLYGTGDGAVPVAQSVRMAEALRGAGKSVRVVALEKDDDWPARSDTRVQLLREVEAFLKENL